MHRRSFAKTASFLPSALLLLPLLGLAGCGGEADDDKREAVSGSVSLDGRPLAEGTIQLIPTSAREGTVAGSAIKDGKFSIGRREGLAPGEYRVVINGKSGGEAARIPDEPPGLVGATDASKDPVPARYNANSSLKAEIKAKASNTLEFVLKSK